MSPALGQISPYLRRTTAGYVHYCPGCDDVHHIDVPGPNKWGASWTFDGDVNSPTFSPSVNIGKGWCHYFIKAGKIQYQGDCHHELKGSTVALPPLPPEYRDADAEAFNPT